MTLIMVKRRTMILEQIQKNAFFFNSREYKKSMKKLRKQFQFHYITSHNCLREDKNKKKRNHVTKYKLDNVNDATKGYHQLHKDICGGKVKL